MPKPSAPPDFLVPGSRLELIIEKLAYGGQALGRVAGMVVFVPQALPGQRVRVEVVRRHSRFAEARVLTVLEQSPHYRPPFCRHFGLCGGCHWQDLAYEEQLRWKARQLEECLTHLGGLSPAAFLPPVASPARQYYRNKMEFAFGPRPWPGSGEPADSGLALGLHPGGAPEGIFNLSECFLLFPAAPTIVAAVRDWCRQSGLPAYDPRTRRGFWRSLVLREGKRTGQILVQLATAAGGRDEVVASLATHLQARFPAITSLVHTVEKAKTPGARPTALRILWGPGYLEERLAGLHLRISPKSFLQPNTEAAECLYAALVHMGDFRGRETVWDLYCGAGGIALSVAPHVGRVVGFEMVPGAVADALHNARQNQAPNCRFFAGDLKELLRQTTRSIPGRLPRPDVLISDPPRSGMHPQVIAAIKALAPGRLLLVSCNPATLARDLACLQDAYEVQAVQAFDFFPHTAHFECLARLERRGSQAGGQSRAFSFTRSAVDPAGNPGSPR